MSITNYKEIKNTYSGMSIAEALNYFTDSLWNNSDQALRDKMKYEMYYLLGEDPGGEFPCIADYFTKRCSDLIKEHVKKKCPLPPEFHVGMIGNKRLLRQGVSESFIRTKGEKNEKTGLDDIFRLYGLTEGKKASISTYMVTAMENHFADYKKKKSKIIQDDGEGILRILEGNIKDPQDFFLNSDFFSRYILLFSNKGRVNKKKSAEENIAPKKSDDELADSSLFVRHTFYEEFAFLLALHPLLKDVFSKPRETEVVESEIRNLYLWNKVKPSK